MRNKSSHYTSRKIPKAKGGYREIHVPSKFLKLLQVRLLKNVFNRVDIPEYCWAFEQGKSIPDMASIHVNKNVVVSYDIKDFFPSITQKKIEDIIKVEGIAEGTAARLISEICTYKWFLPQGAVTSPKISNLIAKHTFGPLLKEIADSSGLDMTIYADDITFSEKKGTVISTEKRGVYSPDIPEVTARLNELRSTHPEYGEISAYNEKCGVSVRYNTGRRRVTEIFVPTIELTDRVSQILTAEGLVLNWDKIKVMRRNSRQYVCGVVVNDKTNLSKKARLRLRAIVHNVSVNGLDAEAAKFNANGTVEDFVSHMRGMINWYRQLRPDKGGALYTKFEECLKDTKFEKKTNISQ